MSRDQKQKGRSAQRNKSGKRKKGRFRKWCPLPGCDRIVVNVGRHLSSSKHHNIQKNSSHYIRLLKTAKRYTGTAELQAYLETSNESAEAEEDQEEEESQIEQGSDKGSQSGDNIDENQEADDDEDFKDDKEDSEESDYQDSENEKETAEKYFTATKLKNNRHQWLVGFYEYLSRPSAGHKKKLHQTSTCRPDEKYPRVHRQQG